MTAVASRAAWSTSRPEQAGLLVVAVAWALLVGLHALHVLRASQVGGAGTLAPTRVEADGGLAMASASVLLMTTAMMGPLALPVARHVAHNSLRVRRDRAVLLFLGSYLAVWTVLSVAVLMIVVGGRGGSAMGEATGRWLLLGLVAVAVVWQLSPMKRRILRSCQRPIPLPARGWRATVGSIRFGLVFGARCVGSCWPLMLLMLIVPGDHLWWTIAVAGLLFVERFDPRFTRRPALLAPGIIAVGIPLALVSAWPPVGGSYLWLCPIPSG